MPIIGHLGAAASGIYKYFIEKSVRFRSSVNAYLTRTPVVAGSKTQMTFSFWVKPSLASNKCLFGTALSGSQIEAIGFDTGYGYGSERLHVASAQGALTVSVLTTRRFRDPTSWYHITVVIDTPNATAADRIRIYVNGVRETAFDIANYPSQNYQFQYWNNTYQNTIGQMGPYYGSYQFDGYMAETHFIDGQALDASYFGESVNGTWIPKRYSGTYGTNGFYLDFKTGTNLSTLTQDKSGNGNNWTAVNMSLTAGQTYDWSNDTPTSNHCTLSAIDTLAGAPQSGALFIPMSSATRSITGTFGMPSGKWYWETEYAVQTSNALMVGIVVPELSAAQYAGYIGQSSGGYCYFGNSGNKVNNSTVGTAFGATFTAGDIIGVAYDADAGKVWFSKNGMWQGSGDPSTGANPAFSGLPAGCRPAWGNGTSGGGQHFYLNAGQRAFAYTPPTNFKSLSTSNLPEPGVAASDPSKHFQVVLDTGTGVAHAVTGAQFQPDFLWRKARNLGSTNHVQIDSVRGLNKYLLSNLTDAEYTDATIVTAMNSNGFTLGTNAAMNQNGTTYANWLWKAGGAAVTNNAGSISSQVSANQAAGFSIVTYTGTGANATVGHGLGVAPKLIVVKSRSDSGTSWQTYHVALTATDAVMLNTTGARFASTTYWNNTSPTSAVFTVGTSSFANTVGATYVAYCFAEVPGFSKIGSYTGNGSADGPSVDCGFRPRFVMMKRVDAGAEDWFIHDAARDPYNASKYYLRANLANAEGAIDLVDFVASGFKFRIAASQPNTSGGAYIFMAFAEAPFKYANAR